jgi:hypothetical protein
VIIEEGNPTITRGVPRPRWIVAVVAAVAILAVAIGGVAGAFLVNGRIAGSGIGTSAAYVPADVFMYAEARLDLPGDQRALLGELLAHFPDGAADKLLGDELPKLIDDKLSKADAPFSYSNDVAPWFNGRVAFAVVDYPSATGLATGGMPHVLAFAGVRDRAAAADLVARLRAEAEQQGTTLTATQHRGVEIVSTSGSSDGHRESFAFALTDDQAIFGTDAAQVEQALDVHAGAAPSLEANAQIRSLAAGLPANRVGTTVVNYAPAIEEMKAALKNAGLPSEAFDAVAPMLPQLMVGATRVESDRVRLDAASTLANGAPRQSNRDRGLASAIPGDAILVVEGNDIGRGLAGVVTAVKQAVASAPQADDKQLEQVEQVLGAKLEAFVDWIGDGALVAGYESSQPYAGLVLRATDVAAAKQRFAQLTSLARLGMSEQPSAIRVKESQVAGTTVTTFHIGAAAAGIDPMGMGGVNGAVMQYAVKDDRVFIGVGDRFVGRALQLQESDSLAASDRYGAAIQSVGGASNVNASFLDLAALRATLEPLLQPVMPGGGPTYESQIKPWLEPLDYLVGVSVADGERPVQRSALVVK